MWGRILLAVIPAKAGISESWVTAFLHETPVFTWVTACWSRHD